MQKIETIEPGQEWTVDLFRPEDAHGVVSLFREIYGDEYPIKIYLDPDLLIQENAAGRVISSVARTARGDIAGHNALFQNAPCANTFESGAGVFQKAYRGGRGHFRLMAHGLEIGKQFSAVEQVFGEPVCNHPVTQIYCRDLGFATRAVEVSLMPAELYAREAAARGRVSTLLDFVTLKSKPCDVYVPDAYENLFPVFYADMDDERRFFPSDRALPADVSTRLSTRVFPFAQVARIAVESPGDDFGPAIADDEKRLLAGGVRVVQVCLATGFPWTGRAVDILRTRGYFFCGVLPRWFDTDGMLMEKIPDEPDWGSMTLQFDRAKELAELVRTDWERVRHPAKAAPKEQP